MDFFLYLSRKGGNVTSTGNGVGRLVAGEDVGAGEGDDGAGVSESMGAEVGGSVPSTTTDVGGN